LQFMNIRNLRKSANIASTLKFEAKWNLHDV